MTNKELQDILSKYPDDMLVFHYTDYSMTNELSVVRENGWVLEDGSLADVILLDIKD